MSDPRNDNALGVIWIVGLLATGLLVFAIDAGEPPPSLPLPTSATPVAVVALTPTPTVFAPIGTPRVSRTRLHCWEGPLLSPRGCPTPTGADQHQ